MKKLPQNASQSAVQAFYITWMSSKGNATRFSLNEKLLMIMSTSYFAVCLELNMLGVKKSAKTFDWLKTVVRTAVKAVDHYVVIIRQ